MSFDNVNRRFSFSFLDSFLKWFENNFSQSTLKWHQTQNYDQLKNLINYKQSDLDSLNTGLVFIYKDLDQLDAMVRARLAKLLDPVQSGSDWRELANRLGFGPFINAFNVMKSPTKALLDSYEVWSFSNC